MSSDPPPALLSSSSAFGNRKKLGPTREEVLACQFNSWYQDFRCVTIRSIVIPLEDEFLNYILSDGLRLPAGTNVSSCAQFDRNCECDWSSSSSCHDDDGNSSVGNCKEYSFPELNAKIEAAIHRLGGAVLPKLNWSAPKDGTWINEGTLKCQTAGDVYILLKSSDFVCHDLLHAFSKCVSKDEFQQDVTEAQDVQYHLVLRKWCNIHVSMEFRCFVLEKSLVAISQRDHTQYYPHLKKDKDAIQKVIVKFFLEIIRPKFTLQSYVFDCYVDRKQHVHLIDFNVWGASTDSLLFEWDDLNARFEKNFVVDAETPIFQLVGSEGEVRHNPLASYRAPIDTIDLATDSFGSQSFEKFMELCSKP